MDANLTPLPPRPAGWHGRLYAWLLSIAGQPHVYGRHDCALFIAGGVQAMHGVDLAETWRGRYTTWRGGLRILRSAGYRDHLDLLARHARPVPPGAAQIGDVAVVDTPDHPALGFVTGGQIQMLRSDGLVSLPLLIPGPEGVSRTAREVWRT